MADPAPASNKRQRLSDGSAAKKKQFTCQLCEREYERADHLARHLDSHRDERTFKCSECPRGFNRRDLLLRHQAAHSNGSGKAKQGADRTTERAIRACDACVLSKLKCGNARPCKRCHDRGMPCTTQSLATHRMQSQETNGAESQDGQGLPTPEGSAGQQQNTSAAVEEQLFAETQQAFPDAVSWPPAASAADAFDFPSFFEHIMDPDPNFGLTDAIQVPPELSSLMPNRDWYNDSDLFGDLFTPTLDQAIGSISYDFSGSATTENNTVPRPAQDANQTAGRRHQIYKQSPWLWRPGANQNAFSEDNNIPLDERTVDTATSPQPRLLPARATQDQLSAQSRDKIFHLIIKTAHSRLGIPSFPSAACLDTLLQVGVAQKAERDPFFHPFTFSIETARPEFLMTMIAAGCVCFNIPSISKTGLILFEIAHLALTRLFEEDNSVIRDLQYLQAYMSWLDTCAFCGFTRKMEIAEANLQPLVTALRRSGKFDRAAYPHIAVLELDEGDALDRKWRQWVQQESFKRLVHHVFKHDMYMTATQVRNPLVSYAEMSLPLPDKRELWLAPSAQAWKTLYTGDLVRHSTSVCELLADNERVKYLPDSVDARLANKAYMHGLAALTWEHSQQAKLVNIVDAETNPSGKLWLQSRYQTLYDMLRNYQPGLQPESPSMRMLQEFLMMSFHVSAENVTSFAGKYGEEEAHRAYKELQTWFQTRAARLAIWHAAQVLRAARRVRPHCLRGPDALIIRKLSPQDNNEGMLQRDAARKAGINTPALGASTAQRPFSHATGGDEVMINGESNSKTSAFISTNVGRPVLEFEFSPGTESFWQGQGAPMCDLRRPQQVLAAGVRVLEGGFPNEPREQLPPLIKSLCDLMDLLGSLR